MSNIPEIKIFEIPGKLAESFAEDFAKICNEVINAKGKINIALSGGSTPKLFFAVLAKNYKDKIDWQRVNFYWVDERCVPADSEDSNFGMTWKILLDKIDIPGENVYRIFGNFEPEEEAVRYSDMIKKYLPKANGLPELDLVLLGMGEDGHTASIFPDQLELLSSDKIAAVALHPDTKQKRITLTGKVINNSGRIYFLVTGKNKSEIVADILEKKNDDSKYPAAHIRQDKGVFWYLDSGSAMNLSN